MALRLAFTTELEMSPELRQELINIAEECKDKMNQALKEDDNDGRVESGAN